MNTEETKHNIKEEAAQEFDDFFFDGDKGYYQHKRKVVFDKKEFVKDDLLVLCFDKFNVDNVFLDTIQLENGKLIKPDNRAFIISTADSETLQDTLKKSGYRYIKDYEKNGNYMYYYFLPREYGVQGNIIYVNLNGEWIRLMKLHPFGAMPLFKELAKDLIVPMPEL